MQIFLCHSRCSSRRLQSLFLSVVAVLMMGSADAQEFEGKQLVTARLISDSATLPPGEEILVGLLLEMAPGWHTYWRAPGDSGLPTSVEWDSPAGIEVGELMWPIPKRIIEPGDIHVLAYKGQTLLMARARVPADLKEGTVTLRADVSWLVCEEICIPGSASLSLDLPVGPRTVSAEAGLFAGYQERLPREGLPPFPIRWSEDGGILTAEVSDLPAASRLDFFPMPGAGETVGHPEIRISGHDARISLRSASPLRGLLVLDHDGRQTGWYVSSGEGVGRGPSENPTPVGMTPPGPGGSIAPTTGGMGIGVALFLGFLGGLILNLMPCVLPVISLKVFGFIRQAGEEPAKIFRHGLVFSAGIFSWFMGLGILVAALKASGTEVTWAFQFQNPWFILAIAIIVFVFALNLFGVFEIILPGKAASAISEAGGEGYSGSFFQGVFATLLATPCTAPFLGTALGFAFSQSTLVILSMFGSVSSGMAAPYILLCLRPGWMKFLPKPGLWMERVKQFMGFPLMATLVWLLSVLATQKGPEGVIWTLSFLLCVGLALWLYGAFCGPTSGGRTQALSLISAMALTVGAGWLFIIGGFANASASVKAHSTNEADAGIRWIPFSSARVDELLAEGRTVFVDFTADWCISCKFNERTAIDRPAVREFLQTHEIAAVKADWTNSDPEIAAALKRFGRVGVPFYVIYPKGNPEQPIILPEILTEQIVLDGLRRAAGEN